MVARALFVLLCALGFCSPSTALDGTCAGLLSAMANHSRHDEPALVFADYVRDGRLDGVAPQAHKADLIPLILQIDKAFREGRYLDQETELLKRERNAHLLGDPQLLKKGYLFGWLGSTERRAARMLEPEVTWRLHGGFLVDIEIPPEGVNPFAYVEPARVIRRVSPLSSRPIPGDPRSLTVRSADLLQEAHFIRLPPGHLGETSIPEDLWIMDVPVTQLQWALVMGTNASKQDYSSFLRVGRDPVDPYRPVEITSGEEVDRFLSRLNALSRQAWLSGERTEGCSTCWRYRLPTAEEWEYAARAGGLTPYVIGNEGTREILYEYGHFHPGYTHRVGMKKPNAWGLYDIHDNVWERTDTYYPIPAYESGAVVRGGTHYYWPAHTDVAAFSLLRVSRVDTGFPLDNYYFEGLRLLREPWDPELSR